MTVRAIQMRFQHSGIIARFSVWALNSEAGR